MADETAEVAPKRRRRTKAEAADANAQESPVASGEAPVEQAAAVDEQLDAQMRIEEMTRQMGGDGTLKW